ncbi:hypothetical protein B2G71_22040 [Novosphingobium sp. PC22D]|nr:hypothetical protein B2G71_22040 [Novosphingobium sp. PC22D]
MNLGKYFMVDSTLTARQQKLIVLRVAHRCGSTYQWVHNSLGALRVGVTQEEVEAMKEDADSSVWGEEDRCLMIAIDGACNGGRFDDATWERVAAVFDRRQIMDVIHASGYFAMVAWTLIALEVQVQPDFAAFSRSRAKQD